MAETKVDARAFINSRLARTAGGKEEAKAVNPETEYAEIFTDVQQYIVTNKLSELNDSLKSEDYALLHSLVETYIKRHYKALSFDEERLEKIVTDSVADMTGYAFLNKYFAMKDQIEEININSWDAIEVRWIGGKRELIPEKFHSPEHAKDVISRILRETRKFLDEQKVYEISYIDKNIRIVVVTTPVVDNEVGVAASIRFVHSNIFTLDRLVDVGFMTNEMADALINFSQFGVSTCVCGATGSGKTTVCNAILENIPASTRLITLEGGTREFDLIRRDEEGKTINNRLHMQTRPHRDGKLNVDLQTLLDLVLKYDPDIVVVGEMVSEEAFIASETARTGHTVMTTIHTNNARDAYFRMYSLGIRKYTLSEEIMLKFMVDAFPIIVYTKMYPDGKRRVQSIMEGIYNNDTKEIEYRELYAFRVTDNIKNEDGSVQTIGEFVRVTQPDGTQGVSERLKTIMLNNGASRAIVDNV